MFEGQDESSLPLWLEKLAIHWKDTSSQGLTSLDQAIRDWLLQPKPRTLRALEAELSAATSEIPSSAVGLRWLALFDGHSDRRLAHRGLDMPPVDFENQFLSWLQQLRTTRLSRTPPSWNAQEPHPDASPLLQSIVKATQPSPAPASAQLLVNLETWEITQREHKELRRTVSRPTGLAFELFKIHESMTFEHFAEFALEVRSYESWLHDHRILNLLSRMRRQFSSWISIKTRHQRIYVSARWERIGFLYPSPHEAIRASEVWKTFLRSPSEPLSLSKLRASLPEPFMRSDLERAMRLSRSSANRMLAQLKKRGRLRVLAAGKNTQYQFIAVEQPFKAQKAPVRS